MKGITVLKCPADFFVPGPKHYFSSQTHLQWHIMDRSNVTAHAIAICMEHLTHPHYSRRLLERFSEAAGDAIPFVKNRSHPDLPLNIGLTRFTSQGQRCLGLVVDSLPLPELPIDIPSPTDPYLVVPNFGHYMTHALIMRQVDGYIVHWNDLILQLTLSWSEPIE